MTDFMEAWKVSEKDFPENGSDAEKLAFCVRYAILAPSSYNTQPWYFRIAGAVVSLHADRRYALPMIDPDDRELTLACAAALYNLRLAIRFFGYKETTELLPSSEDDSLIARVRLGTKRDTPLEQAEQTLFRAITKRHTNLGAFNDKPVPEEALQALKSAATQEGAWLHVCVSEEKKALIRLVAEADHIQSGNKHFRRELAAWLNPRRVLSGDGVPGADVSYSDIVSTLSPTVFRRFETSDRRPANDRELEEGSPVLAVLGSNAGNMLSSLAAGQAYMRIWLQAEALGLSVSTLNQPCEVPALRLRLHDELEHHGRAQIILRIGYGGKPTFTPRRKLADVLEFEGKGSAAAERSVANDRAQFAKKPLWERLFKGAKS